MTVADATGQVEVPDAAARVVTFDMSVLDSLDTLGVPVVGLPKQNVPEFLAEYEDPQYADVGTLFEANLEAVNAADPDLILIAGRSSELKDELAPIAPVLDMTIDSSRLMADFERNARTLGTVFGKEADVEKRLADLNTAITETNGLAATAGRGLILLTNGNEATAYGPGSRFGIIHDVLGVRPAIPDVETATHGEAISFELVAQTDPDRLFVVDRDAATGNPANAQQVLDNDWSPGPRPGATATSPTSTPPAGTSPTAGSRPCRRRSRKSGPRCSRRDHQRGRRSSRPAPGTRRGSRPARVAEPVRRRDRPGARHGAA